FKSIVLDRVRVTTATPASVRVVMLVGSVNETVEVTGSAAPVESSAITSTIESEQMRRLPLITRNALNFTTFLPGVDTAGTHNQRVSTTIAGLPQTSLAISIDGVNTQDNYAKSSDGFFSMITPTIDAVEEVTVVSATPGADSSAQ